MCNRSDAHHQRAVAVNRRLRERLVTTWPVSTKATDLWAGRNYRDVGMRFLERCFSGTVQIVDLDAEARPRILALMRRYAALPMDLAAACLVILAEKLGHGHIPSTDQRDFETYRWKNHHPFENLLLGSA